MSNFQNIEAEQSLLGNILVNNNNYWKASFLRASEFYEPVHQRIYAACQLALEAGGVASPITLKAEFDKDAALAELGGAKYLMQLAKQAIQIESSDSLAAVISRASQMRQLKAAAQSFLSALDSEVNALPCELAAAQSQELEIAINSALLTEAQSDNEIIAELKKDTLQDVKSYSTGITALDEAMGGGILAGRAYGFAAPKKSGKTAMLATLAENLNQGGTKTLYVALEMGSKQIMERIAARRMGYNPSAFLKAGRKSDSFQAKLDASKSAGNLFFLNYAGIAFADLKAKLLSNVRRLKPKVIIIDYWQLIGGKENKQSEREHLDAVAQWITEFAKCYDVAIVMASQTNQDGNTRGGEGIRLAFDQVYKIISCQVTTPDGIVVESCLEIMDTRYTEWQNVGSEVERALRINPKGVFFEQIGSQL